MNSPSFTTFSGKGERGEKEFARAKNIKTLFSYTGHEKGKPKGRVDECRKEKIPETWPCESGVPVLSAGSLEGDLPVFTIQIPASLLDPENNGIAFGFGRIPP